ncbi:glycosyltransferase family 39 protein [Acidocella aminolytica]|uniref:Glycosyl/arabinosyl/mannosyl transferase n=1 Tax=Acidocella aminolytica 101 = DSM 11237 TaxID=1120923 RepID=A0A0D6PGT3_9PROT|nr:glycosyltransferase family 39 protein [Acidocella aminolytica]GAN80980.1 glycosyl/arabinosyl/mannosyl transferase [Acidocella aminolytica 101 = DSM 11237]GBQ37111.1 4-amino-4-deoxy-L-arabinose transferase [Acidocella aminolytica 101 = DSM 11237]SHF30926.1 Dolichyl-phosphate-mannose-protein mannosyltransferase [Acidocella aminolytica 101 = DSM 11237]
MVGPIVALLALTALRLALAAILPLTPDETYYFTWAQHLQAGYLDHPPMVALWIKLGTTLLGNNALGIRLFGPLAAALGSVALYDAGNRLLPGQRLGLPAAAFLNATLMLGAGSILMTPDTPLLFFWTLGVWALVRLAQSGNARWWLAAGAIAGLALLSKYTAALLLAGAGLWALTCKPIRAQLRTPWPWAGIALAFLVFGPDIAWNANHGWASYLKQGSRVDGFDPARALQFFGELIGGQSLLLTPLVAILAVWGLWRLRRIPAPSARLLFWLTLVPAVIFLEHTLTNRVESNWPAILYPSACLAAAVPRRWFRPALAVGFGITGLVYLQAVTGFIPISPKRDTAALQMAGWQRFAQQAAATHPAFLTSDDYATASELAFYAPKSVAVLGFTPRWTYFNWPVIPARGETGLLITRRSDTPCPNEIGTITRKRGHEPVMLYKVCQITAATAAKDFPRP